MNVEKSETMKAPLSLFLFCNKQVLSCTSSDSSGDKSRQTDRKKGSHLFHQ